MNRQTSVEMSVQPDNAAALERDRLTAGFRCALTPEEKRRKLRRRKVVQFSLGLEAENEEELNGWFPLVDFGRPDEGGEIR